MLGFVNLKKSTELFKIKVPCLDNEIYKGMKDIDDAMHFADENGSYSESFYFNDRAPLVQLQEICSGASIDASDHFQQPTQVEVCFLN